MTIATNKVKNVLYVPGIWKNLVSVGKLTNLGHDILFTQPRTQCECVIFDNKLPSKVCMRATRDPRNNLCRLSSSSLAKHICDTSVLLINHVLELPDPTSAASTRPSSTTNNIQSTTDLWHRSLCHANYQLAFHMSSKNIVTGRPHLELAKDRHSM